MLSSTKAVSAASVLLLFLFLQETAGLARVSILFVKYNNPGGKGNNGHCCDGRWGICQKNGCDHKFTICLGVTSSERNVKHCKYGRLQSRKIPNQNDITFGSSFGGVPNPMYFTVNEPLPTSMDLKVDVWDSDGILTKDDFVDFLKTSIKTQGRTANIGRPTKYNLQARTRLVVQLTVKCASYWYGDRCSLYCKPRNDYGGHYKCLPTGQKQCLSGWTGPGCKKKEETKCPTQSLCRNGATCIRTRSTIKCICTRGFFGTFCHKHVCERSCRPGICLYLRVTPRCSCPRGYSRGYKNPGNIPICRLISNSTTQSPVSTTTTTTTPTTSKPRITTTTTRLTTTNKPRITTRTTRLTTTSKPHITTRTTRPTPASTSNPLGQDCDDLAINHGYKYKDGLYTIKVKGLATPFQVYCDMSSRGRTLIQQRVDASVNFNRTWHAYKVGFGTPGINTNYWMGLEKLHHLTRQRRYKLLIKLQLYNHAFRFATYSTFRVESENSGFKLRIGGYSGNAGDALSKHNGAKFSTYDRDNDSAFSRHFNCAKKYGSGWWFKACFYANLNGVYKKSTNGWPKCKTGRLSLSVCIKWGALSSSYRDYSLRRVTMYLIPES